MQADDERRKREAVVVVYLPCPRGLRWLPANLQTIVERFDVESLTTQFADEIVDPITLFVTQVVCPLDPQWRV